MTIVKDTSLEYILLKEKKVNGDVSQVFRSLTI